jgi:beta-lactamase family protein
VVAAVITILLTGWRVTPAGTPQALASAPAPTTSTPPRTTSPSTPMPAPVPVVPPHAVVDAAQAALPRGMTLSVAVLDVTTGQLAEGGNARRSYISASLSKLIVVVDMLDRRRAEGLPITDADLELVGRALRSSDDGAMNVLWGRFDGMGAIRRVAGKLGLSSTRPPGDPREWGDTMVTAGDFARMYQHIVRDMAPEDRSTIVTALAAAAPAATDGFAQHFGLLRQGASAQLYAKQAWVPYRPAGYLLHSAGVAHDTRTGHAYAITLLSIQSSIGEAGARDRLSAVAAAALGVLGIT